MPIPRQYVIDSTTKKMKRGGYSDFLNDGEYNGGTEEIITVDIILDCHTDKYWNGSSFQNDPI